MSSVFKELTRDDAKPATPLKFAHETKPAPTPSVKPHLVGVKISIIFAFLLSIAALLGAVLIYQALDKEKARREALESAQAQLREKTDSLKSQTDQYKSEIARIREQLKTYVGERDQVNRQLEKSRIDMANLQKKIKMIEDQSNRIGVPVSGTQELKGDSPVFGPQLAPAGQTPVAAKTVQPAAASEAAEVLDEPTGPQVLTVNRKFNFVVVNLGLRDNLRIGDKLAVKRDGKNVGTIQVEKLYDNFSAANILEETNKQQITEKDTVQKL